MVIGGSVSGTIEEFEKIIVGITEELPETGTVVLTNGALELGITKDVPTDGAEVVERLLEDTSGTVTLKTG